MTSRPFLAVTAAAALGALLAASPPAGAQTYAPGSTNTVRFNVQLDSTAANDYGKIVETVFNVCQGSKAVLFNGPYRRTSNKALAFNGNTLAGPEPSTGDARLDYLVAVWQPGMPTEVFFNPGRINDQLGFNPTEGGGAPGGNPGGSGGASQLLSARVAITPGSITVTDTTQVNSQIVDAGPTVGGMDAIVVVNAGTPTTLDIVCDPNMYYRDASDSRGFKYGLKDFVYTKEVNTLLLLWAAGPSGAGSQARAQQACGILNPSGTPERFLEASGANAEGDYKNPGGTSCPAGVKLDPSLACVGAAWKREERTDGGIANVLRFFGDPEQPANFTACGAIAGYCDPNEPVPDPGQVSGNACNKQRGISGFPNTNQTSTLEGNTGQWVKIGGSWIYVRY